MQHAIVAGVALLAAPALAQSVATTTIVEGEALVVRGATRLVMVAGLPIQRGDILHTDERAFVRIEAAGGAIADIGPGSRLMVAPPDRRAGAPFGEPFLLSGWLKLTLPANASGAAWTPHAELREMAGVAVLHATDNETTAFVESGKARALVRGDGAAPVALAAGSFYQRKARERAQVASRPAGSFLGALPRAFRDTLPSRLAQAAARKVQPKSAGEVPYSEARDWLVTDVAVRRHLVQRWRGRLADPAFRSALVANMAAHPEWDPIVFPEKYKPKESKETGPEPGKDGARKATP